MIDLHSEPIAPILMVVWFTCGHSFNYFFEDLW